MSASVRTLVRPAVLRTRRGRLVYWSVLALALVLFTAAFIVPLYWAATGAMKAPAELARTPPTLVPETWQPENYARAWREMDLGRYFLNTVVLAGGAWLVQLAVQVPAAYALSKLRPRFGNAILALMLLTLMMPVTALLVPVYLTVVDVPLFNRNLLDSPSAVWLPAAANAFNIYILKNFFDRIPDDILDAARIDGAGPLTVMVRVVLPLARPIIAVVSILSIVTAWKDFLWPLLVIPDPAKQPLSVFLQRVAQDTPLNILMAGLVLASVPLIALFLLFQRQVIGGLSAGGLKG
ncbi:carbohydrate ABC transporter permease [Nocardiopsis composta]|uniref:Multiple sugar transport system permease protein n=1 Tax=Nocardiopsis composta TaxID=157465 RepID=A0A7W8VFQ1_9ACTN|nr:carbohydrate ABC transporter permease [Nocardiopsis composta]MBB5434184.1 multiple sugar transport system permease protein [Nocardiopsis composta]